MTLTQTNIVEAVAEQNGYPKNQSFEMIETLLEIVRRTLEPGEDGLVGGFEVTKNRGVKSSFVTELCISVKNEDLTPMFL